MKIIIILFVFCAVISSSYCVPSKNKDLLWFPNPRIEGGFIPALLKGNERTPINNDPSQVKFFLYTKGNKGAPDLIYIDDVDSLNKSHFIKNAPVKIMSHGFGGSYTDGFPSKSRAIYLDQEGPDMNIICIDWAPLAVSPWYAFAANNTKIAGFQSAKLLHFLLKQNVTRNEDIHFVGFSLGAHVAGNCGMEYEKLTNMKLPRITGLDAAYPLFGENGEHGFDQFRIDPTDGVFVDVIHTSSGHILESGLGFPYSRGHVDFWPNEGKKQPGCEGSGDIVGSCSHGRAPAYWEESIDTNKGFNACICKDWDEFSHGFCKCDIKSPMGEKTSVTAIHGDYYLYTMSAPPFALG